MTMIRPVDPATPVHPRPARRPAWRHRLAAVALGMAAPLFAQAAEPAAGADHWIATWSASAQATWGPDFALPTNIPATLENQTLRQVARISLGGKRLRIVLSNEYGAAPLVIGAAHAAPADAGPVSGAGREVTFGGKANAIVAPGATLLSDPVDLVLAPLASVAISLFLPNKTEATTFHWDGRQTAYLVPGNQVAATHINADSTISARIFLSSIQIEPSAPATAVVVLGDSITDGNGASIDADARWTDFLAARLAPENVAVLNAGISGARMMKDKMGDNALARFERDALMPHVKTVIVWMGINDISWPGTAFDPDGLKPSAEQLIARYRELISAARQGGVRVVGATLTPFEGALTGTPMGNYYNADKDRLRHEVNAWIRGSGQFDAVLDFDALLKDPAHPARLKPAFDSGDHLHPGDYGNRAIAESIDLNALF